MITQLRVTTDVTVTEYTSINIMIGRYMPSDSNVGINMSLPYQNHTSSWSRLELRLSAFPVSLQTTF